jgi:hypothetical protein
MFRVSRWIFTSSLQNSYQRLSKFWQTSYELFINFSFRTPYEVLMKFLWSSYEVLMNFLWTSYELLMNFLWTSYELLMNFLWASYELPMNFWLALDELLTNIIWTFCELVKNIFHTSNVSYKLLMNFFQTFWQTTH